MTADESRGLIRFAIILTLGLLAIRLLTIGRFGFFADESYYWLWSENLAFGYYDHPPMIALFIRAGTILFGDTEFGVRLVGALSVAVDVALVYGVARVLFDSRRIAAWAAIFANLTFMATLSVVIVPDHAMLTFWLAGLYGLARIARGGSGGWWLLVGGMFGLAAASKYSTFFMAAAVLAWLALVPELRKWFRSPWPYLGLGVALAVLAPVILWNVTEGWPSVNIQLNRDTHAEIELDGVLRYLAGLVAAITPIILVLALVGLIRCLRRGWHRDPVRALLVITPVPLFAFFAYYSVWEVTEPHWTSPIAFLASILAAIPLWRPAAGVGGLIATSVGWVAVLFGIVVTLSTYAALAFSWTPFGWVAGYTDRFHGWDDFGRAVEATMRQEDADYLVSSTYGMASQLRFYTRDLNVQAYQLGDWERDVFGTAPRELADSKGLFVGDGTNQSRQRSIAEQYYDDVTYVGVIGRTTAGGVAAMPAFIVSEPRDAAMALFGASNQPAE